MTGNQKGETKMTDIFAKDILNLMQKFDDLGYTPTRQKELLTTMFEHIIVEDVSQQRIDQWEQQQKDFHED